MPATDQWLRRCSLLVLPGSDPDAGTEKGMDLSQFRIRFKTHQHDQFEAVPPWVWIRVTNLAPSTEQSLIGKNGISEYGSVILQAGYETGKFGVIFKGTIKQFRRGHESPTDSFLDIYAASGDAAVNFAASNTTIAAGAPATAGITAATNELAKYGLPVGYMPPIDPRAQNALTALGGGRGTVQWGMSHHELTSASRQAGWTWTIDLTTGKIILIPLEGYLPGEAIQLNSATGMVEWPEQTNEGINVKCLLNPALRVGNLVQINNADINQTHTLNPGSEFTTNPFSPTLGPPGQNFFSPTSNDGFYRILVLEHDGDTRAIRPWYSNMVCVLVDVSTQGTATSTQGDTTADTPTPVPAPLNEVLTPSDLPFLVPGTDTPLSPPAPPAEMTPPLSEIDFGAAAPTL